jgi:hypothetical protein
MSTLKCTWFNGKYDAEPKEFDETWDAICAEWLRLSTIPRTKYEKEETGTVPAICPVSYSGNRRLKDEALAWSFAGFDIDHGVTFDEMKDALDHLGWTYCIHTTTTSMANEHRLRVLLPITRDILAAEYPGVWASFNLFFGGVLDHKTRDISRLFYVPAAWRGSDYRRIEFGHGSPVDIDRIRRSFPVEIEPEAPPVDITALRAAILAGKPAGWRCLFDPGKVTSLYESPFVSAATLGTFNSARKGSGRFFSFLVSVALSALYQGYEITVEELVCLGLQLERRKDAEHDAKGALKFASSKVVAAAAASLNPQSHALSINYMSEGCGEGKTTEMLAKIAKGGRWLYAVDKIDSIAERREEFQTRHGWRGRLFGHYDANSRREGDDEDDTTVPGQLKVIRSKVDADGNPNVLCFITHQALAMLDWTEWRDFNLVIDEVIDVWRCYFREFHRNGAVIKEYLEIDHLDGDDSYVLRLTEDGKYIAAHECNDAIDKTYHGILVIAAKTNNYLWVNKRGWDDPGTFPMEFWTLVTPECLLPFGEVWMLGDQLDASLTFKMWESQFGVRWQRHELAQKRRRACPTAELLTIKYFTLDNASFSRFTDLDGPLTQIVKYLQAAFVRREGVEQSGLAGTANGGSTLANPPDEFIWTCNAKFVGVVAKRGGLPGEFLTPKQHGSNRYSGYTCAVWLAAMQASGQEAETVKRVCGMTRDQLIEARELNALYQFAMRIALRDFTSEKPCVVYVFSARQASYLQARLGGKMEHIDGVVFERDNKGRGGRPAKSDAMSPAERQRKRRAKLAENGQSARGRYVTKTPYKGPDTGVIVTHPAEPVSDETEQPARATERVYENTPFPFHPPSRGRIDLNLRRLLERVRRYSPLMVATGAQSARPCTSAERLPRAV